MPNWYALYVKPRKEKAVEGLLTQRNFETFSPAILEQRCWSDRIKTTERILFPGYVFCRFRPHGEDRLPVLTVPGVNWIVGNGHSATPVPEDEITALRRATAAGARLSPHEFLTAGDRVEILSGPLAGTIGILSSASTKKNAAQVVLSVELLRRSVAVEVPADLVRPLQDRRLDLVRQELAQAGKKTMERAARAGGVA